jgi:hypothetical protein
VAGAELGAARRAGRELSAKYEPLIRGQPPGERADATQFFARNDDALDIGAWIGDYR